MRPLFALVVSLMTLCLFAGPAAAAPLAPLPGPDSKVKAIDIFTAGNLGPSEEVTSAGCQGDQPIADVYFKAQGTGTIRVTAQRNTTDPNPTNPSDVLWSQLIKYEVSDFPNRVVIPVSGDGEPFNIIMIPGPTDTSGPGQMVGLVVTHEACDAPVTRDAFAADPLAQRNFGLLWKIVGGVAIFLLAWLIVPRVMFGPKKSKSSDH